MAQALRYQSAQPILKGIRYLRQFVSDKISGILMPVLLAGRTG